MQASANPANGTVTISFNQSDTGPFAMAYGVPEVSGSGFVTFGPSGHVVAHKGVGASRGWKAFIHECFSFARSREHGSGPYPAVRRNPFGHHEAAPDGYSSIDRPSWPGMPPAFRIHTGFMTGNLLDPELVGAERAARIAKEEDIGRVATQYALALRDEIMGWYGGTYGGTYGEGSEVTVHWGDGLGEDPAWLATKVTDLHGEREDDWIAAAIDVRLKIDALDHLIDRLDGLRPKRGWFGTRENPGDPRGSRCEHGCAAGPNRYLRRWPSPMTRPHCFRFTRGDRRVQIEYYPHDDTLVFVLEGDEEHLVTLSSRAKPSSREEVRRDVDEAFDMIDHGDMTSRSVKRLSSSGARRWREQHDRLESC